MMQDPDCELTPLTKNGRGRRRKCASSGGGGRYAYYLDFVRQIWLEISTLFWKLVIFLLLLVIVNTILRSILVKETSLMFTSSVKGQSNGLSSDRYALSAAQSPPHLFWIVTDLEVSGNTKYLHELTKQGIVLQRYHISEDPASPSINRVSALISKYSHHLTADDLALSVDDSNIGPPLDAEALNENEPLNPEQERKGSKASYFRAFDAAGYRVEMLSRFDFEAFRGSVDGLSADSPPILMYIEMDGVGSMRSLDAEIGRIVSYLKRRESVEIWQNSLLIVSSDSNPFSVLSGPRIPNKQRGTRSKALFDVTDWQQTLLHFAIHPVDDGLDGYDLWDSIIYGADSPRTELPKYGEPLDEEVVRRDVVIG